MKSNFTQLFLRISIAASFLSAVADRLGYWGEFGEPNVSWGNWENFLLYSNTLNSFLPKQWGISLALLATLSEIILALLLIIGYKTRIASMLSGILLTFFALAMALSLGLKSSFDYSVWIGASACFLLSRLSFYSYSIDNCISKKRNLK